MKPRQNTLRGKRRRECVKGGFTLIEMIVAVSLFTVVVFVSVGALLAISDGNRKANSLRTVMDNLNFSMESMSRSIRTGTNYSCNGIGNCAGGGDEFEFTDQYGNLVVYGYDAAEKSITVNKGGSGASSITSSEVDVDDLQFYVTGVGADGQQPRVIIIIRGTAGIKEKTRTSFNIQTTVSQRQIDS